MGAIIGIGALINKNTFEGGRLFKRRAYWKEGTKSNHYHKWYIPHKLIVVFMGAIRSTKSAGNFGLKLNGWVWSNRKSFKKASPPFEVDHFSHMMGYFEKTVPRYLSVEFKHHV